MGYKKYNSSRKPRQEISRILKYIIFFVNLIFWISGIVCTGLGIYLYSNDFRPVLEAIDFFLNPSILLIVAGIIVFLISFLGCTGALREHVCLLKLFSLSLFLSYIVLVILTFVVFILFYSDSKTGISIQTVIQKAVAGYGENKNMVDLVDTIQLQLQCCGAGSLGYKDYASNPIYNCSKVDASPERCGVPYSCCKRNVGQQLPNARCGFQAQEKQISELQSLIYVDGCVQPLQKSFEGNAVIIGAVIGAIIVPVCISVTLSNVLAKQIQRQRYLLDREARRDEKRLRHHKHRPVQNEPPTVASVFVEEEVGRKVSASAIPTKAPSPPPRRAKASTSAEPSKAKDSTAPAGRKGSDEAGPSKSRDYRKKPKEANSQAKIDKEKRKKSHEAGAQRRRRASSTGAHVNSENAVKKRKRRSTSQDPNEAKLNHERRRSSGDELDKELTENRINQEIERANTPLI